MGDNCFRTLDNDQRGTAPWQNGNKRGSPTSLSLAAWRHLSDCGPGRGTQKEGSNLTDMRRWSLELGEDEVVRIFRTKDWRRGSYRMKELRNVALGFPWVCCWILRMCMEGEPPWGCVESYQGDISWRTPQLCTRLRDICLYQPKWRETTEYLEHATVTQIGPGSW